MGGPFIVSRATARDGVDSTRVADPDGGPHHQLGGLPHLRSTVEAVPGSERSPTPCIRRFPHRTVRRTRPRDEPGTDPSTHGRVLGSADPLRGFQKRLSCTDSFRWDGVCEWLAARSITRLLVQSEREDHQIPHRYPPHDLDDLGSLEGPFPKTGIPPRRWIEFLSLPC